MNVKKILLAAFMAASLALCACGGEGGHVELADPFGGSSIVSAADLETFFLEGTSNTAVLSSSFSMEDAMLKVTKERGDITIDGNGCTLSGTADCIIRIDDGCKLTLNNVTLHSGAMAIGALGNAEVGGAGSRIIGISDGILCTGKLTISPNSTLTFSGTNGCGVEAEELSLGAEAKVSGDGVLGGIEIGEGGITLEQGASLSALTAENFNALKCEGTCAMSDGSALTVQNDGKYHGAEIYEFSIDGTVSINAAGGKEATGLFVVEQQSDMYAIGGCTPTARYQNGKGRISFVASAAEIPAATPVPTAPTAQDAQETE